MLVLCLIPMVLSLIAGFFLHAAPSFLALGFLLMGAVAVFFFREKPLFLFLSFVSFFMVLLFQILLIPGSVYQAWYLLLSDGRPEGTVSGLFSLTAGILSFPGFLEWTRRHWLRGLLYLLLAANLLLILIFPGWMSFLGLIVLLGVLFLGGIPKGEKNSRNLAGILVLLLLAFLLSLASYNTEEIKGSPVVNRISQRFRRGLLHFFPAYPLLFSLPGYGASYQDAWDGGPPVLTGAPLFEVTGSPGEEIYLKTESFSRFSGLVWVKDPPLVPEEATAAGASSCSGFRELLVLTEYFQRLPYTEKTKILSLDQKTFYHVGSEGRGLEQKTGVPLRKGRRVFLYEAERPYMEIEPDPLYLDLPEFALQEYGELAQKFFRDDPEETALLLRHYLKNEFTYSLDTEPSSSPVADFLFQDPKGYCVHFASAFAVLARLNGIPTRLGGGFLVQIPEGEGGSPPIAPIAEVSGYSAHRWPEIFLPDKGWVIVEVTPPFAGENDQTRPLFGNSESVLSPSTEIRETGRGRFFLWGVPLSFACLMILFLWFGRGNRLNRDMRRTVRHYKKLGVLSPEDRGWAYWVDCVADRSPCVRNSLKELKDSLFRYAYGPGGHSSGELIRRVLKEERRSRNRGA